MGSFFKGISLLHSHYSLFCIHYTVIEINYSCYLFSVRMKRLFEKMLKILCKLL